MIFPLLFLFLPSPPSSSFSRGRMIMKSEIFELNRNESTVESVI